MKNIRMKKTLFFFLLLCAPWATACVQARRLTVNVEIPGTLSRQIAPDKKYQISAITLRGVLNGTDLRYLREMAGSDVNQEKTAGRLVDVDLSGVSFDASGLPYVRKDGPQLPTSRHAIPPFLFRNTLLERVVLPENTDTIGIGAFEYTQLRRIVLPEGVTVCGWAFNCNPQLSEVVFPEYTSTIGDHAFSDTPLLRRLSMNDVGHISGAAFIDMPSVEHIEVKGSLAHIDGWQTVANCPRLKRVDFCGLVYGTGGSALFVRCPELSEVVFHDVVGCSYIGQAEDCPKLGKCKALDVVVNAEFAECWEEKAGRLQEGDSRLPRVAERMYAFYQKQRLRSVGLSQSANLTCGSLLYQAAVGLAKEGQPERALDYLQVAFETEVLPGGNSLREDSVWQSLHGLPLFDQLCARSAESSDYLSVLKGSAPYHRHRKFTYASPNDSDLVRVRNFFNLDSIAGKGDEISRIKNVMYWLHDHVRHNGSSPWPECRLNAIELYQLCQREDRAVNCRLLAMMLNEMYLSLGFKSRFLTCQSKQYATDNDCHVINVVWSDSLGKWIWMDPTFAAYVTDENGLLLHPGEVRDRLIGGQPLVLNPDANWNHQNIQTKEYYLETYMAKNLYLISAWANSCFETEGKGQNGNAYIVLQPEGFRCQNGGEGTSDDEYFWQRPE